MKRIKIGAIDIGSSKVCTIMADTEGEGSPRVLGVGVAASRGLQKGLVVNLNEAKLSIRESIRKAEQISGHELESAFIGVTGRYITSVNSRGTIVISHKDQMVRTEDLRRVLRAASGVKAPGGHQLLHVIPMTYIVDGQEGVKNPVGMHGFRVDVEAHIITGVSDVIQNLAKCVRSAGVEIEDLVTESLASAEAVLSAEEREDGVILADIGGETTGIAVFKDNKIYHTSVVPAAGGEISRDISIGLGLSLELAEEVKKKCDLTPAEGKTTGSDKMAAEGGREIPYHDLVRIIRCRVEELLQLIMSELPKGDQAKLVPAGLVLCGGTAKLPGIVEVAERVTRLPVRIGTPARLSGVADTLLDPAYAAGVGLLMWRNRRGGMQTWKG